MLHTLNKFLRIVIVILLIVLAVLSVYYKYDDCSVCRFEYENETINAKEFMEIFSEKCLMGPSLSDYNLSAGNFSGWFF